MTPATLPLWVFALHLASTLYMVGLVWFVQRVHYPLFAQVGPGRFRGYEQAHVARTGPVVGPPMLLEAASGLALAVAPPAPIPLWAAWLGLALLAVIWLSTALLQIPRHRDLADGYDARAHGRLVGTNWIRTLAWTLRGALVVWMVLRLGAPV